MKCGYKEHGVMQTFQITLQRVKEEEKTCIYGLRRALQIPFALPPCDLNVGQLVPLFQVCHLSYTGVFHGSSPAGMMNCATLTTELLNLMLDYTIMHF